MTWRIHHRAETVSTNLDAREGLPGDVFTADFQFAGRGRLDHKWLSPPGENLILSAVIGVAALAPEHVATLPLAVGLAVRRGLARFLPPKAVPAVKWPNDLLVDGRKICGILCERVDERVIAGLGVNVRAVAFPPPLAARATSLALLAGKPPAVTDVRDAVLEALAAVLETWREGGFAALYPELVACDYLRGKTLGVLQTDDDRAPLKGLCGGIRADGALLVGGTPVYAGEAHVLLG